METRISIITAWGSEGELSPYFLSHYAYADEIVILYGPVIEDDTLDIAAQYPNTRLIKVDYPNDRWDMGVKQMAVDKHFAEVSNGWVYYVDADELIFPMGNGGRVIEDPHEFLSNADGNIMKAWIWQVFRNEKERDLVPALPAVYQRRYGDPDFDDPFNVQYIKPCIARPEANIAFHWGAHRVFARDSYQWSSRKFCGTHWHWADADIAVASKNRKERLIIDPQKWLTDGITEETIREKCRQHLKDPRLF